MAKTGALPVFCFNEQVIYSGIILLMTEQYKYPDNVHFIDEYPELAKKVWLRRLAEQRLGGKAIEQAVIFLPAPSDPDGAA